MTSRRDAALKTLQCVGQAIAAGVAPEDRFHLAKLQREALAVLEAAQHRPGTIELAERVRSLDHDLEQAGLNPRERSAIIRARLGLTRSRLCRLRSRCASKRNDRRA